MTKLISILFVSILLFTTQANAGLLSGLVGGVVGGAVVGAMTDSNGNAVIIDRAIPNYKDDSAYCLAADNLKEYQACRRPWLHQIFRDANIFDSWGACGTQSYLSNKEKAASCSLDSHLELEWRMLNKLYDTAPE